MENFYGTKILHKKFWWNHLVKKKNDVSQKHWGFIFKNERFKICLIIANVNSSFLFFSLKKNHKCIWIDSCLVLLSMLLFVIENIQIYVRSCTGALIFLDSRTVDDPIPVPVPLVFYPYSVPVPHFWNWPVYFTSPSFDFQNLSVPVPVPVPVFENLPVPFQYFVRTFGTEPWRVRIPYPYFGVWLKRIM